MTGIEALDQLAEEIMYTHSDGKTLTDYDSVRYDAIAKDLKKLNKLEKVIEIIKKKNVNIFELCTSHNVEEYNDVEEFEQPLTQEEFKLLNEVFENERV